MNDRAPAGLAVIERQRAALYRWFAGLLFAPPSAAEVLAMQSGDTRALLHTLAATPGAEPGVAAMRRALEQGSAAGVAIDLNVAHGRLFDGIGGKMSVPLYRSAHGADGGVLCQQATADMEDVMQKHRLQLEPGVCEPSDHLSLQLELMAQLALRTAEVAEGEAGGGQQFAGCMALLAEQAGFLDQQLLDWLPLLAGRLSAIAPASFHAGVVAVLLAVLRQDRGYLGEILAISAR